MANEIMQTDQGSGLSSSMMLFLTGAAAGAIAALLFAPQAGRETRKQLNEYGRRTSDTMNEWAIAAYDLFTSQNKLNGNSHQGETAQRKERQESAVKPPMLAVGR